MELWIRSQDKRLLLKVDNIKWFGGELYTNGMVCLETIKDDVEYLLGTYQNGKRALEVFDEIQRFISEGGIVEFRESQIVGRSESYKKTVYEMPKE